jgi:hypothetical protein
MDGQDFDAAMMTAFRGCEGLAPELDPRDIGARVLLLPEHEDLARGEATIDWLFRTAEKRKKGRRILGTCYMPSVQGDLSDLFDHLLEQHCGRSPDYLIVLDWVYWQGASPREREILCFHELKHAGQARDIFGGPKFDREGRPMWAVHPHDIEEFDDVVRRYGVHSVDVASFLQAVAGHMEQN